ncbi:MAG: peptide/nickel transport system permease protein [Acidimicrobiaceae bacterium]|nr:peptide/nickel transport system permease protein [Acidimicrobiaceae bacterium]
MNARYLGRKVLLLVPVLFAVSALSFLLLNLLPGDPAIAILGPSATEQSVAALRHDLDLDQPLPVRYVRWMGHTVTGDLGRSYVSNQPTVEAVRQRLPVTLELLLLSQLLALALAIPLALLAASKPNGLLDRASTSTAFAFLAIPNFMLGVLLIYLFAVRVHLFPATGYTPFHDHPIENLRAMALPAFTLGVAELAVYLRLLRSDLIATLQQDYITMAQAKGMSRNHILLRHALRPSAFSLVTAAGLNLGRLIGGAFVVEYLFALPGIGALTVESIFKRDYIVVQGTVLLVAVGYVLANFAVDVLYGVLDPRVRHARATA